MIPVLQIDQLVKDFGRIRAVNHLCLEVCEGSVFGLLGPNGSGKTTTLGIILDVIRKTSGQYRWFGKESSQLVRRNIGAILEVPAFYPYLSARRNLEVVATIKGRGKENIERIVEMTGLAERIDDPYRTYSLGMKQRISIGAALLADPPVLILDEPTNGLDPIGIAEIRQLIRQVASQGKTIILASHILDEVQKVCSHFAVLRKGSLVYTGSVIDVLDHDKDIVLAADDMDLLKHTLSEFADMKHIVTEKDRITVSLNGSTGPTELHRFLIERGIVLSQLMVKKGSLEQKFLDILRESDAKNH